MVGHAVKLTGAQIAGIPAGREAPVIMGMTEQVFAPWFLARIGDEAGQQQLSEKAILAPPEGEQRLKLFQPVHRIFNMACVEASCVTDGEPRLDPAKIITSGVCVRRRVQRNGATVIQGWIRRGSDILGWRDLPGIATAVEADWDPAAEARLAKDRGLNARVLSKGPRPDQYYSDWSEDFAALHAAPPETCAAIGKTVLYGFLPVTSAERSEEDPAPAAPFDDPEIDTDAFILDRLPGFLRHDGEQPRGDGALMTADGFYTDEEQLLVDGVRYLSQEPGLFTEEGAEDLRIALSSIYLSRPVSSDADAANQTITLLTLMEEANEAFVERRDTRTSVRLPNTWPAISTSRQSQILSAVQTAMSARWSRLSPVEARYEDLNAVYEVRAFARIAGECGCPPKTIWTAPSDPFVIAPWYEGSDVAPTVVELPAVSDGFLGGLKPNVAFKVPEEIQQFMSALKLDDLMDGKQPKKKLGIGMICGFSIPIITICAFIVLQIFLVLFHILFWWLPFIRICIPFPKIEEE